MKRICIFPLFLMVFLLASSQQYVLDFGTDTCSMSCTTPYTGVTTYCSQSMLAPYAAPYSVDFISSNFHLSDYFPEECRIVLQNPGDTSIGSGSEVQFRQGFYPELRLQVSGFEPQNTFHISFKIKINKPSPLHHSYPSLMFYFGGKTQSLSFPLDTSIFGLVNFNALGSVPNYYNSVDMMFAPSIYSLAQYPVWSPQSMEQGMPHKIDIFANTTLDSLFYLSPRGTRTLAPRSYVLFIDSMQIYVPLENNCFRGSAIAAFSWHVREPNYYAPIIIDDVEWGSASPITTLPVQLSRLEASVCTASRSKVCLSWRTELEINNNAFVIERSADGSTFDSIGTVPGFGTTTYAHEYQYEDNTFLSGIYYYRLKQIDFDGMSEYSPITQVRIADSSQECNAAEILKNSPEKCIVFDCMGKIVKTFGEDVNRTFIPGMYIVLAFTGEGQQCRGKIWIK